VLLGWSSSLAAQEISRNTGQVFLPASSAALVHRMPAPDFKPTAAYQWLELTLEASGRDAVRNRPRPTVLSRTDAIVLRPRRSFSCSKKRWRGHRAGRSATSINKPPSAQSRRRLRAPRWA
jgi:hypothetical protein